jgi:hypothetical protein
MRVAVVRHWFVTRKGSERRAVERGGRRGCALRQVRAPNGAAYNRDMQGMRDVLRGSLGRSLRALSDEDRLAAAWPVACGSVLAERAEVLELDGDGVLHVRVLQTGWREQFVQMRTVLTDDLRRIAGVRLQRIHFEGQGHEECPRR